MATHERSWLERIRNRARRGDAKTAFVLSGGGNLGAIQVGMLRALIEDDVRPDLVLGCSVGALNGAALAQEPTLTGVARLEDLWRGLAGKEVMPASGWLPGTVALARRGEAVHDNEGLRRLLEGMLHVQTFEELRVPFQCVATDMAGVREVWFSSGPLIEPILASSAVPALYPAVEIDGVEYHDGAIVNDVPMTRAVELGARTICVLQVGAFARPRPEPRRPLDVAIEAYWVARHHRFKRDLASMPEHVDVLVLPTGQPGLFRYNDFTHSGELMTAAHDATRAFLAERAGRSLAATAVTYTTTEPDAEASAVRDEASGGLVVSEISFSSSGPPETVLDAEPSEALAALDAALTRPESERRDAVAVVAARWPRMLDAWARLGELGRDDAERYAAFRVGYHRGLDRLRASGWRGSGYVRWAHETNRGFLRALEGMRATAAAIGEHDEEERCALFLRQLDPDWPPT